MVVRYIDIDRPILSAAAVRLAVEIHDLLVGKRGTAAIEFAIVLPVLFLFAFGLIDLGRMVWTRSTLDYAAQATARCTAVQLSTVDTNAICYSNDGKDFTRPEAYGQSQAYGLSGVTVVVSTPSCGAQATVTANFTYFLPLLSRLSGPISAAACYPK